MGHREQESLQRLYALSVVERKLEKELEDDGAHVVRRYLAYLDPTSDHRTRFPRWWCNAVLVAVVCFVAAFLAYLILLLFFGKPSAFLGSLSGLLLLGVVACFWTAYWRRESSQEINRKLQNTRERIRSVEDGLETAKLADEKEERELQEVIDRESDLLRQREERQAQLARKLKDRSRNGIQYEIPSAIQPSLFIAIVQNYWTTTGWRIKQRSGGEAASELVRFYAGQGVELPLTIRIALQVRPNYMLLAIHPQWHWGAEPDDRKNRSWSAVLDDFDMFLGEWIDNACDQIE